MINKEEAITIAKNSMPQPISDFQIENTKLIDNVWCIGLRNVKNGKGFEVEIDADTGKIIGGGGG